MSQALGVLDKTFIAGEDLSNYRYYAVYLSDDHTVKVCTTSYLNAIGILQNNPKSGEEAVVRLVGTTKAVAAGSISAGTRVKATTAGKIEAIGTAGATEQEVIGVALESSGGDGEIIEIFLIQESYVKGTT